MCIICKTDTTVLIQWIISFYNRSSFLNETVETLNDGRYSFQRNRKYCHKKLQHFTPETKIQTKKWTAKGDWAQKKQKLIFLGK